MKYDNPVTSDLSKFGQRQLSEAGDILKAWSDNKLTRLASDYFDDDGVTVAFNTHSGKVFLTNSDYQVLVLEDEKLDLFIWCGHHGSEGTMEDLAFDAGNGNVPEEDALEILENYDSDLTDEQRAAFIKAAGDLYTLEGGTE